MDKRSMVSKDGWFLGAEPLKSQFVNVLGVRFHRVLATQAVEQMLHWIAEKSRRMVITAGPEFVMKTVGHERLGKIAYAADLVTADGIGVVWAANRQGLPVPERVTGVELVIHLFEEAKRRHQALRVYILGAAEPSLQRCLEQFRMQFPEITFEGRNGYFQLADVAGIIKNVEVFAPDVWLVGLGQPRQEELIYEYLGKLPPCVAIGVGGSIDAWSGSVPRAPVIFQKMNVEWLYRLLKQPTRIRRQLVLPRFAWKVMRTKVIDNR